MKTCDVPSIVIVMTGTYILQLRKGITVPTFKQVTSQVVIELTSANILQLIMGITVPN